MDNFELNFTEKESNDDMCDINSKFEYSLLTSSEGKINLRLNFEKIYEFKA